MPNQNSEAGPAGDIHEILRLRRESLHRVQASLKTVGGLQREFAESQSAQTSHRYPLRTLESVDAPRLKLISIGHLRISLTLHDGSLIDIEYPSAQTLTEDLRAWAKSTKPDDLKRLDIHPHTFS